MSDKKKAPPGVYKVQVAAKKTAGTEYEYEVAQPPVQEEPPQPQEEAPPAMQESPPAGQAITPSMQAASVLMQAASVLLQSAAPQGQAAPLSPAEAQPMPPMPNIHPQGSSVSHERLAEDMKNLADYDVGKAVDYISKVSRAFDDAGNGGMPKAFTPRPLSTSERFVSDNDMLIVGMNVPFHYQEAYHSLRTNIKYLSENQKCRKIIVTSSIPAEGKSVISINLALALSATNSSVGLVDADFRKPMLHSYLGISGGERTGLSGVLRGVEDVKNCLYRYAGRDNLYVVPCGEIPPNPTEILSSSRMEHFIDAMAKHFDYVIIDTPPVSVVTDAAVLSRYADGVLMVVRQKMVTFDQARRAKRHLENVDANIIGAVLNDFDTKHLDKESGYYYSDYYTV